MAMVVFDDQGDYTDWMNTYQPGVVGSGSFGNGPSTLHLGGQYLGTVGAPSDNSLMLYADPNVSASASTLPYGKTPDTGINLWGTTTSPTTGVTPWTPDIPKPRPEEVSYPLPTPWTPDIPEGVTWTPKPRPEEVSYPLPTPWTPATPLPSVSLTPDSVAGRGAEAYQWGNLTTTGPNMDWANQYRGIMGNLPLGDFLRGIRDSGFTIAKWERSKGLPAGTLQRLFDEYNYLNPDDPLYNPDLTENEYPYATYGFGPMQKQIQTASGNINPIEEILGKLQTSKDGGLMRMKRGGKAPARTNHRTPGGQDDVIPALLAPGEYVFDAEIVAALGDGNTEAGAAKLDQMRKRIRQHKRTGGLASIPPRSKDVMSYLGGKKNG